MTIFVPKKRANRETKKPKYSPKQMTDHNDDGGQYIPSITFRRFLHRIPVAFLLMLMILFIWSSSTTILSGSIVHICVSSRKLSNLYCLSAGTQPNLNGVSFPPLINKNNYNNENTTISITSIMGNSNNTINTIEEEKYVNVDGGGTNINDQEEGVISIPGILKTSNSSGNSSDDGGVREKVDDDDEIVNAVKAVKQQLQVHRSWSLSSNKNNAVQCDGRGVFVYDLPTKFNKDLVAQCGDMVPWMTNFCEYLTNEAKGQPISKLGKGWYNTHQYSLEPIFHSRVLKHPCRVNNEKEAKLFYVPYYGGLDILRWHFRNVTSDVKDKLGMELMEWLEMQQSWDNNSGKDHVFVLGKISWDFRRHDKLSWGTRFLRLKEMENPLKLLIERHPWEINEIGVPHPTYFHPQSDNDIIEWQMKIIRSNRKNLISFAGAARPGAPENIRSILIKQCTSREDGTCTFFDCSSGGCSKPESVVELFMESEFCLQPPGDSPTRKSVFDSLLSGCIPVLFDPFTAYYQYPWHLPEDHGRYSVFIDQNDVRDFKVDVVEKLMKVSVRERDDMRRYIVYELLPRLVYGDSNSELQNFKDAFSISMDNLLDRVARLNDSSIA